MADTDICWEFVRDEGIFYISEYINEKVSKLPLRIVIIGGRI